jgi:hypothetical protein
MNTKTKISGSFILVFITASFFSCTNESGNPSSYSPFDEMPVVTGLYYTSEASPEVIAVWGNPSGASFCYPSIGDYTRILFSIPKQLLVKVWIVPARLPQQESEGIINSLNAHFEVLNRLAVNTLLNEVMNAGTYELEYHFTDSQGRLLPEGLYRIYIQATDRLEWCDVFNFRNESNYYKVLYNQIRKNLNYIWSP